MCLAVNKINLLLPEWDRIFKEPGTITAEIHRAVHHSVVLDLMGIESYGAKVATTKKSGVANAEAPA